MNPPLTPMAIAFAASPRPINQIQAVRRLAQIKASSSRYDITWSVEANVRAKSEAPSLGRNATICTPSPRHGSADRRSEEHTSELQSHSDLVCRLLLEKKKKHKH